MASTHIHDEPTRLPRMTYGAREVAEVLGLSERTVRVLIAGGTIPSVRVGGRRLVRATDLDAYIAGLPAAE